MSCTRADVAGRAEGMRLSPVVVVVVAVVVAVSGCSAGDDVITYASLDSVESVDASGRQVTLAAVHGACDEVLPAEVTEDAREVRVRVPLRQTSDDCDDIGLLLTVRVTLAEPLGQRSVVDAERSRRLPLPSG